MKKAIALVSGGHVSTAALLMAKSNAETVIAVHLAMDHQHAEGYKAAKRVCDALGIEIVMAPAHNYGQGWLADMLRQAGGFAAKVGADAIYLGVNDATADVLAGLDVARATLKERWRDAPITVVTPMIATSPDLPFGFALDTGHLEVLVTEAHSCEHPTREPHPWGYGCGACAGCTKRRAGWDTFEAACGMLP